MKRFALLVAACGGMWVSVVGAQSPGDGSRLSPLTEEVNALVMSLGESQMAFMQPFVATGQRSWGEDQLEAFRQRVQVATLKHPDVMAARAARRATQSSVREAWAAWYPQVSTQLSNGKINNDPSSLLGTPARAYNNASFNVTVRQLVYDFGAASSQIDSNNAKDRQTQYRQFMSEADVAYRATQSYHELVRATRQFELAKRNEAARNSILDLVQQRYDIGGGTLSDVVRAQSRLAESRANVTTYQKTLGAAQASYREFFAEDVAVVPVESPVFDVNATGDWMSELGLAGQTGWKVRVAQAASAAASADMKNVRAKTFASINLEVSSTRRDWISPGTPGTDNTIALVARQSLYTGGADSARIEQALQKMQQSEEELRSAELEYKRQLEQLTLEVASIGQLVSSRQTAAALAADSLRMVREQYAYRRGTLLDLLTAQESLYIAGRDLIDAQVDKALLAYKLMATAALLNQFMGLMVE